MGPETLIHTVVWSQWFPRRAWQVIGVLPTMPSAHVVLVPLPAFASPCACVCVCVCVCVCAHVCVCVSDFFRNVLCRPPRFCLQLLWRRLGPGPLPGLAYPTMLCVFLMLSGMCCAGDRGAAGDAFSTGWGPRFENPSWRPTAPLPLRVPVTPAGMHISNWEHSWSSSRNTALTVSVCLSE
jgi:hypothetical protein